jgi:hypothetical protein
MRSRICSASTLPHDRDASRKRWAGSKTAFDHLTYLEWEVKTQDLSVHDHLNQYT